MGQAIDWNARFLGLGSSRSETGFGELSKRWESIGTLQSDIADVELAESYSYRAMRLDEQPMLQTWMHASNTEVRFGDVPGVANQTRRLRNGDLRYELENGRPIGVGGYWQVQGAVELDDQHLGTFALRADDLYVKVVVETVDEDI